MLVLTRRIGESIIIGEKGEFTITVLDNRNHRSQIKLGIDAPKDIPVHREEIYHRILQEKNDKERKQELEEAEANGYIV